MPTSKTNLPSLSPAPYRSVARPRKGALTAQPLHVQISADLRRQIHEGTLKPGDTLPSEGDLMARFAVARGTVRQALATLRLEGVIAGPQGHPPTVCDQRLEQSFTHLVSFSAWVHALGLTPSARLIELALRPASAEAAAMLELPLNSLVYELLRVRLANDEPLLIERTVVPQDIGLLLTQIDLEHHSIYAELQRQGVIFASAHQVIDALSASAQDAQLLQASAGTPLLRVRRQAFAPDGRVLEWSDDRYLATRVTFSIDNSAARPGLILHLGRAMGA